MRLKWVRTREMATRYNPKTEATTMRVRESVYDYLVAEAQRRKRTPQGEMELMAEMFRMIVEEFQNDDPEVIRGEIRRLRKLANTIEK